MDGGVDFVACDMPHAKLMLGILGAVAEFENDIRRERQQDGIVKAKAAGRHSGRPPSIDPAAVRSLKAEGVGTADIARPLERASIERWRPDGHICDIFHVSRS